MREFLVLDPDKCENGLSLEMTLKLDLKSYTGDDIYYIVDSGASTFNSRGFSLYVQDNKLRADVAIANKAFCLETPIANDRWQDLLLTWKKGEGSPSIVNMFVLHLIYGVDLPNNLTLETAI